MSRRTWNGELARAARLTAGLKPDDAAERLGVHRASVFAWESGREPQLRYAAALADLYDITLDELFTHDVDAATAADRHGQSPAHTNGDDAASNSSRVVPAPAKG